MFLLLCTAQVKIAQRIGLIQHLPTGTFDGCKKNREWDSESGVLWRIMFLIFQGVSSAWSSSMSATQCATCPACTSTTWRCWLFLSSGANTHIWFWPQNVNNLNWRWRTIPNINTCSASTTGWCAPSLVQVVWSPWMLHFWVGAPRPCNKIIPYYFSLFQWPMITSGCEVLFGGSKLFVIWTVTSNP